MNIFQWLKDNKYDYTWNVKIGGKTPDVIGFNDREIIAFEIKRNSAEVTKAIGQCLRYLKNVNKVYMALPSKAIKGLSKSSLHIIQKSGIGLIQIDGKIKILLAARNFGSVNRIFLKQLRENSLSKPFSDKNIKSKITGLLSEHPEGLSISGIAKFLGMHRHTAVKYINQLLGSGAISIRKIGPVKLCYLKEGYKK